MNIPGFTAEDSLYKSVVCYSTQRRYTVEAGDSSGLASGWVPQWGDPFDIYCRRRYYMCLRSCSSDQLCRLRCEEAYMEC
jgi:hypothetical protein